jgi:hypothetical protein
LGHRATFAHGNQVEHGESDVFEVCHDGLIVPEILQVCQRKVVDKP